MKNTFLKSLLFWLLISISTTYAQKEIYFETSRYTLTSQNKQQIKSIIDSRPTKIFLEGRADSIGNQLDNLNLSKKRVDATFNYIVALGFPKGNISMKYFGETNQLSGEMYRNRSVILTIENSQKETKNVSNIFEKFQKKHQVFEKNSSKPIKIVGAEGTEIEINPTSFQTQDGSEVSGNIKIEMIEYLKKSDMIFANLHTMSDQNLLETGGMLYIKATQNQKELKLKQNQSIKITFPTTKKEGMQTFNGVVQNNTVNWEGVISVLDTEQETFQEDSAVEKDYVSKKSFRSYQKDPVLRKKEFDSLRVVRKKVNDSLRVISKRGIDSLDVVNKKQFDSIRNRINILINKLNIIYSNKLEWINCDRFTGQSNLTNIKIIKNSPFTPEYRLVFKKLNSIMIFYNRSANVPVGEEVINLTGI